MHLFFEEDLKPRKVGRVDLVFGFWSGFISRFVCMYVCECVQRQMSVDPRTRHRLRIARSNDADSNSVSRHGGWLLRQSWSTVWTCDSVWTSDSVCCLCSVPRCSIDASLSHAHLGRLSAQQGAVTQAALMCTRAGQFRKDSNRFDVFLIRFNSLVHCEFVTLLIRRSNCEAVKVLSVLFSD